MRNADSVNRILLNEEESKKALARLCEDLGDQNWHLEDVQEQDLLRYLDVGDLVNLLNRHASSTKNAKQDHVYAATELIVGSEALAIRKRVMHPVRPLEPDDLPKLVTLAQDLRSKCPSLHWAQLAEAAESLSRDDSLVDVAIPSLWAEEYAIFNNLPPAEFDDTGFIGRSYERRTLRKLLESDHRLITVVGGGGEGKTALALRVCNDFLEENCGQFDRIVWVSLKTKYLTAEGVREISNAVDSVGALIEAIIKGMSSAPSSESFGWNRVLESMGSSKILLVIDNLETVGGLIRDLVLDIPPGSKVLLTSRVGLGELELRFPLGSFASKDARYLFRSLANTCNYISLRTLADTEIDRYCKSLYHNPLLIKWFVQAAGKGVAPELIIRKNGFDEALDFCYANVYESLSPLARRIVSILLASRRVLTKAQLQDLTGSEHVPFIKACQELLCSSIVVRVGSGDEVLRFQVGGLVYEYLSRNFPPENHLVSSVRERIRHWQVEQDKSHQTSEAYRYGPHAIHVETTDERIAAPHLRNALRAAELRDFEKAAHEVSAAKQLTPSWWELYRVQARVLDLQGRPIYEIEEAFELSLKCKSNDVNCYHYAVYLVRSGEFDRALEQIENAIHCQEALEMPLRGLRGWALLCMGRLEEAIVELQEVWRRRSQAIPAKVSRAQATQLAEAYRRKGERMVSLGNAGEGNVAFLSGATALDQAMDEVGYDQHLVETAVEILAALTMQVQLRPDIGFSSKVAELAKKWDGSTDFRRNSVGFASTEQLFLRYPALKYLLPTTAGRLTQRGDYEGPILGIFSGKVKMIDRDMGFGFIVSQELGDIHFNKSSLTFKAEWRNLDVGTAVSFKVTRFPEGQHAVDMEIASNAHTA
jgi:LuxR family glucitol operon transcriptional activator